MNTHIFFLRSSSTRSRYPSSTKSWAAYVWNTKWDNTTTGWSDDDEMPKKWIKKCNPTVKLRFFFAIIHFYLQSGRRRANWSARPDDRRVNTRDMVQHVISFQYYFIIVPSRLSYCTSFRFLACVQSFIVVFCLLRIIIIIVRKHHVDELDSELIQFSILCTRMLCKVIREWFRDRSIMRIISVNKRLD